MDYFKQIAEIRACCRNLLEEDRVDVIIAYSKGGLDGLFIPFFARTAEDTDKLEWSGRCYHNLATYLHGRKDRVGIVAKPCDVRAIIQYIIEKQLEREQIYIIGVDCCGMTDETNKPRPACGSCRDRIPPVYDTHIIDERASQIEIPQKSKESHSPEIFKAEIDKCILCFSCRQACYGCYCKTCFVERGIPNLLPAEIDKGTKMTFHLGKAMHLAGRCVECGACEAVCASGVKLRYLIQELTDFVEENYDYRSGMSLDAASSMLTFGQDDRDIGFLGGEE